MKRLLLIAAAALAIIPGVEGARRLTLGECLEMAFAGNPSLRADSINMERSRLMIGTAFDAPNTEIELSQDATDGGGMENGLKFSQEFEFPTVYVARRKVLKADYAVARGEYAVARNELAARVMSAYYTLLSQREKTRLLQSLSELYERFETQALARYSEGETSHLEYMNAVRLNSKVKREAAASASEYAAAQIALMSLLGSDEPVEPADGELTVVSAPDAGVIDPMSTPSAQVSLSELARARHALGAARQDFLPGLFVSATSQLLIKSFNPYNVPRPRFEEGNFMGFQVGITVPLFFGAKKARLQAARRDVDMAASRIEDERNRITADFRQASIEFGNAADNLRYYEEEGLAQAREMRRLAAVSYELDEIDYMEYIQNMETASAVEMEYIESVDRYNQAAIRLMGIKGIL